MNKNPEPDPVADLVLSMLCVNGWKLEKAWAIREGLQQKGMFDLKQLASMSETEIFRALKLGGYSKADYVVGLLAERLHAMASVLSKDEGKTLNSLARRGASSELDTYLLRLKGVGPVVLETFKTLHGVR